MHRPLNVEQMMGAEVGKIYVQIKCLILKKQTLLQHFNYVVHTEEFVH